VASPARQTSLKLLTDIAQRVRPRAEQLNLNVSTYVAILIWNQAQSPRALTRESDSPVLARVNVPCNLRRAVAPLLKNIAGAAGMSENAIAEALIARDLRSEQASLTILPSRYRVKYRLPPAK